MTATGETRQPRRGFRRVALGLGSNLGDPEEHLAAGVRALAAASFDPRRVSSVYRSAPVGPQDQPDYLNAVVVGTWDGGVDRLLALAQQVERERGRVRTRRHGPRPLDVDLLLVDDLVRLEPDPVVPHPRWTERSFVLAPLAEVAGHWKDPVTGASVREIWTRARGTLPPVERVAPPSRLWSPEG